MTKLSDVEIHDKEPNPFRYLPVFSGKSIADEKIVVYRNTRNDELCIKVADGELWALSPGSTISTSFDRLNDTTLIHVVSPEWTGDAIGTKHDLIEEEALR